LTPRQRIVSSGYAINADTVDGAHASTSTGASTIPITDISGIINLTASTAGISATSTNALTIQGNGTGDIRFFSTSNALSSTGNLTIAGNYTINGSGTSTIATALSVGVLNLTNSSATSTFANGIQLNGGCFRDIGGTCIVAGATTALSNLASVAINTSLLSDTNNTDDLGSYLLSWRDLYASGTIRLGNSFSQYAFVDATSTLYSGTGTIRTNPTDNIGNVGLILDTRLAIANAGAKLLSIREGGSELSFFDSAGGLQAPSSTITGTFSAAGAGTFYGALTLGDGGDDIAINSNDWDISSAGTATGFSLSTSTIDNMIIGGSTAAAGTFTTLNASSTSYLSHLVPSINNAYDLGSPSSSWRNINAS
jgi:hypothetical protein